MEEAQEDGKMKKNTKKSKQKGKKHTDRRTGERLLSCPRCGINMKKLIIGNIVIDVCSKCKGMWADAGEVEKLAKMMVKGGKK